MKVRPSRSTGASAGIASWRSWSGWPCRVGCPRPSPSTTASHTLDLWAYLNGVEVDFSRPGKPTDNAFIKRFNARVRDECLNEIWFLSLEDSREKIDAWRRWRYNAERPHRALGNLAPWECALAAMTEVG